MTTLPHNCAAGGFLVNANGAISPHAFDYMFSYDPVHGCNNLRCSQCQKPVKNAVGLACAAKVASLAEELYRCQDASEAVARGLVKTTPIIRLYFCECITVEEDGQRGVRQHMAWGVFDDDFPPWLCGGHPDLSLPCKLDGVMLTDTTDWSTLVRESLLKRLPSQRPPWMRGEAVDWLSRLFAVLPKGSEAAVRLSHAVASCLTDASPHIRKGAADFFRIHSHAPGSETVSQVLRTHPHLYFDVPDPDGETFLWKTLDLRLQSALSDRLRHDEQAKLEAREIALSSHPLDLILVRALFDHDLDWTLAHALDIYRAHPTQDGARSLLYSMHEAFLSNWQKDDQARQDLIDLCAAMGQLNLIPRDRFDDLAKQLFNLGWQKWRKMTKSRS